MIKTEKISLGIKYTNKFIVNKFICIFYNYNYKTIKASALKKMYSEQSAHLF